MSRGASVCAVQLCVKWDCLFLRGLSHAFSCFLLVSIINISVRILLWLSMSKQTDPHGSAESFSSAAFAIHPGHWTAGLVRLERAEMVSPCFNFIFSATAWRFPSDISLPKYSSVFPFFPLPFSNPTASSLISLKFLLTQVFFFLKKHLKSYKIHTVSHY